MTTTGTPPTPQTSSQGPLPSAKVPVGTSRAAVLAMVLAVAVTALGVLAVRDALVAAGALTGTLWLTGPLDALNGLTAGPLVAVAGVLLLLLGLWLVLTALRRRPRTTVALRADTGVFLRPRDLSRLAETAAEDVDGVLDASVASTTRTVSVRVRTTGAPRAQQAVQDAVTDRLRHLERPPTVRVRVRPEDGQKNGLQQDGQQKEVRR